MKEDRFETRVGAPGTARMTFRGPLLPSRRRAAEVPLSLAAYHGFAVIAAAHDIERRYEEALYPVGISLRDFAVMAEIAQRPGIGQAALAHRVGLGRSRLSDHLAVLETEGLIERLLNERDLRRRRIWVSREGQHALAEGRARIARADHNWMMKLKLAERVYLRAMLERLGPDARAIRVGYAAAT
jgi:MarR family transcriptional regulator for hemolysin